VNELRIGYKRTKQYAWGRCSRGDIANLKRPVRKVREAYDLLPKSNGIPFGVVTTLFPNNFMFWAAADGSTREQVSPLESYGDTLSWSRGTHAIKFGGEFRTAGRTQRTTAISTLWRRSARAAYLLGSIIPERTASLA
jgi:hypothetical protein